jgi:hypothetical protein
MSERYGRDFFKFFESIKFQGESVWKRVLRFIESLNICVQNVFFSNGVLETHGKV